MNAYPEDLRKKIVEAVERDTPDEALEGEPRGASDGHPPQGRE